MNWKILKYSNIFLLLNVGKEMFLFNVQFYTKLRFTDKKIIVLSNLSHPGVNSSIAFSAVA